MTLPLLFILPIIIISLILLIFSSFFLVDDETDTIPIGLVNQDKSDETELLTKLLDEASQLSHFVKMESMPESDAETAIIHNEISAYIIFPENFIRNLLYGNSVRLPVIGNPDKTLESFLIRELVDSVTRHIRSSQANILTINEYAKKLGMTQEEREKLIFEQFKEFVFYTLGSNQVVQEKQVDHSSTTNPIHYFSMSFLFVITTIWLLVFYHFLHSDSHIQIKNRIRLYGVTELQQSLARIIVVLFTTLFLVNIMTFVLHFILNFNLEYYDYLKVILIILLYSGIFLLLLAIIDLLIPLHTIKLIVHSLLTIGIILLSGAIIPSIYLPLWIQEKLPYLFSFETFHWLTEIVVNNRIYTDFLPLCTMFIISMFIFIFISSWKEKIKQ